MVQDGGGFGHFDHEGRAPGGEIVGGADAGENAVERTEDAAVSRHVTADVGKQGDQRGLPHISRFTAHVGAGNQQQAAVFGKQTVVGDKGFGAISHFGLNDRMTTASYGQPDFRGKFRFAPVALQGGVGEAGQQVKLGDGAGDDLQRRHGRQQFVENDFVEQFFAGQRPFLRRQRLVLESLEFGRDVTLGILQSLAAAVIVGNLVGIGVGDFNIEAMHLVVFDLEAVDAAALALAGFHVDQVGTAVVVQRAQFVEIGIETGGNCAAVADLGRGFGGNGADQQIKRCLRGGQIDLQLAEQGGNRFTERRPQGSKPGQRFAQAGQIPRPGIAQGDAASDAFDIGNALEIAAHLAGHPAVVFKQ